MRNTKIFSDIQKVLKKEPLILACYIFGSYAKGVHNKESDFDIAVVVTNKKLITEATVYELIKDIPFPKNPDISVVDKTSSPIFLFQIIKSGSRIYAKDENNVNAFEAYVLRYYYDTQHLRNIYNYYLKEKFRPETISKPSL